VGGEFAKLETCERKRMAFIKILSEGHESFLRNERKPIFGRVDKKNRSEE